MRDYLHAQSVEFDDRNIRQSEEAREELAAMTGNLIVPLLIFGDRRVIGYDPDGLHEIARAYHSANVGAH